jgi:hypothetical protein
VVLLLSGLGLFGAAVRRRGATAGDSALPA